MKKIESKIYELSEKLPTKSTQIQLTNNNEIEIEGSKKIIEYDENLILLRLEKNILKIIGTNLKTDCFSSGFLTIYGNINSLEFIEVKNDKQV